MVTYLFWQERRKIYSNGGFILPKKMYQQLQERNGDPPFRLYGFTIPWDTPHVELYDDYCRKHDPTDYFEGWDPAEFTLDSSRFVLLPKSLTIGPTLENSVLIVGDINSIQLWSMENSKIRFPELPYKNKAAKQKIPA